MVPVPARDLHHLVQDGAPVFFFDADMSSLGVFSHNLDPACIDNPVPMSATVY